MPVPDAASPVNPCGAVPRSGGEQALSLDGAVFVDDTGRRARAWAGVAMAISLIVGTFLVVLVTGVLAPADGPRLHLPPATAPLHETVATSAASNTGTGSGRLR